MRSGHLSEIFTSFQGEGTHVGRRHLFVRFAGCNLRCRYCDTPDSLVRTSVCTIYRGEEPEEVPNPLSVEQVRTLIAERLAEDTPIDAISFTGGEPLVQADFLAGVLRPAPAVPVLLETAGVLPAQLERVIDQVDIVSMDIKLPSNTGEPAYWVEHAEFLRIARRKDLYVKLVVDERTSDDEVERAVTLVRAEASEAPIFLQPMTGVGRECLISGRRLTQLFTLARRYSATARILPQTHKLLGIQ